MRKDPHDEHDYCHYQHSSWLFVEDIVVQVFFFLFRSFSSFLWLACVLHNLYPGWRVQIGEHFGGLFVVESMRLSAIFGSRQKPVSSRTKACFFKFERRSATI